MEKKQEGMEEEYRDPVCNMRCDKDKATGQVEYQGKTYHFCSDSCQRAFEKNPEQYVKLGPTHYTGEPLSG